MTDYVLIRIYRIKAANFYAATDSFRFAQEQGTLKDLLHYERVKLDTAPPRSGWTGGILNQLFGRRR